MEKVFLNLEYVEISKIMDSFNEIREFSVNKKYKVWEITNELKPIDLFCYLVAKFGRPNGPQTLVRKNASDNLIHWDWVLKSEFGFVTIQGHNFRTEIHVNGDLAELSLNVQDFVDQIKSDYQNYGKDISIIKKKLEKWTEFLNPFYRIKSTINHHFQKLDELELDLHNDKIDLKITNNQEEFETTKKNWSEILNKYDFAVGLVFGLRSMLPVLAESFINLLIFVLCKPEIKNNKRLYESTLRQQIDIRVQSLHLNCNGFKSNVDYESEECKKFHTLMNERNDLLHGNVNVNKQSFGEVYFVKNMPIFNEYQDFWDKSIGISIKASKLDKIYDERKIVDSFIKYILDQLEPNIKDSISMIIDNQRLGFNEKTGRIGILFPPYLIDFRGFVKNEDEFEVHIIKE